MKKLTLLLFATAFAFVANSQLNLNLLSQYQYPGARGDCSDIWGYVDEFGNEYAIVGNQTGVSIMDVTIPTAPVELLYAPGANTIWRDMKVWGDVAYITNEGGNGLMIIDMTNLPGPLSGANVTNYTGSTYQFSTAHNIFIDEVGRAYICGADNGVGGAIILDVNTNPLNPIELGRYNDFYLHDIFVRNDTLWGGAINDGFFVVVDVSNPASCNTMATQLTPDTFSHNCWLSDDGNTVFTTDEVSDAFIGSYDVSDINNITEIDRIQSSPGQNVIPHNVFVRGNYLITSYYRDGVVIHDAANPSNLIEVGNYDTSPAFSGDGFNGCWGVYPYLPSGNIIASDIEGGLFVLGPNYTPGCYLEGLVTDQVTTNPISGAQINIVATTATDQSDVAGTYATGVATAGTYDVTYSKLGYVSQTITGITLTNGITTIQDVQLVPLVTFTLTGEVIDVNGNPIANAQVHISSPQYSTTVTTNGIGNFSVPSFLEGTYDVTVGLWGYHTLCLPAQSLMIAGSPYSYTLETGYSDFFDLDLGWTVSGNASTGDWERGIPNGTTYFGDDANPGVDSQDCGEQAYITGNGGGNAGDDDIDGGVTILTSPLFDLSGYNNPYIDFDRWFFNGGGTGTPNDSLVILLSNGTQTAIIDFAVQNTAGNSQWLSKQIRVVDFVSLTSTMQIKVRAMDNPSGHLAEGGFDNFVVSDSSWLALDEQEFLNGIKIYPVPFSSEFTIDFSEDLSAYSDITIEVYELSTGRMVRQENYSPQKTIAIKNDFAKGMYLVKVYNENELLTARRIVKM